MIEVGTEMVLKIVLPGSVAVITAPGAVTTSVYGTDVTKVIGA